MVRKNNESQVLVAGGGLAGLISAILLRRHRLEVVLVEKQVYPFHRVCGEYISNETRTFLHREGLWPHPFVPTEIGQLQLTSVNGREALLPLDLGGFGISRFSLDHFLYQQALSEGVQVLTGHSLEQVRWDGSQFQCALASGDTWLAKVVIGSFGKRSKLDKALNRPFFLKRSPYVGVKYHMRLEFPSDRVALHNFQGGYCGINGVENDRVNVCYLTERNQLKKWGDIPTLERQVLHQNPFLKEAWSRAEPLFEKPEVINEISFETKGPIHEHILMTGDAAGMITPLCGNGMAMAIHSAALLAPLVARYFQEAGFSREQLEQAYSFHWRELFAQRLWAGRQIQRLFGHTMASNMAVNLARFAPPIAQWLVKKTHGVPF
jgi:menaquinone-9 beta-reductase